MATEMDATSLLAALNCRDNIHLIIGTNPLAAARCGQSLSAGAKPILIAPETAELHYGLAKRIEAGEVTWHKKAFQDNHLFTLGREEVGGVVDAVLVTSGPRDPLSSHISALCRKNRIPVNVVDAPHLCTFSLLSTHTDGPLQIGVTTNGRGCKLASRIRRDVAASLPPNLGAACARLGQLRRRIQQEDRLALTDAAASAPTAAAAPDTEDPHDVLEGDADDSVDQSASFNRLVAEDDADAAKTRRIRWLSQVCEYWPLKRLAAISDDDVEAVLASYATPDAHNSALSHIAPATTPSPSPSPSILPLPSLSSSSAAAAASGPSAAPRPKKCGRIILAGSGPGHPDLLTRATHKAIQSADLILADKLVPSAVLDLVPRRTQVRIARKFPGNADAAQDELHAAALSAARDQGQVVVRLKQGDPFLYGRGGEEVAYFRANGVPADRVVVLPGLTSALCAPLFAGVPATMRDVADQVLVCTGTGKKGRAPEPPGYRPARTAVVLMALHRIEGLVEELTSHVEREEDEGKPAEKRGRVLWPRETPCAVVERASCPDQRVIRTTLGFVAQAIEAEGSRPPGLLVVGRACEALFTPEKGRMWTVEEGFRGLDVWEDVVLPV